MNKASDTVNVIITHTKLILMAQNLPNSVVACHGTMH